MRPHFALLAAAALHAADYDLLIRNARIIDGTGNAWFRADVAVKDTKRYAATGGWGYYNFKHGEPKAPTAKLRSNEECAACHTAGAKKDMVWTQFYPRLDR